MPKLPPLVPARLRFGVPERLDYDGAVIDALSDADIDAVLERVQRSRAQSLAICLLHAYANPVHEERLGQPATG